MNVISKIIDRTGEKFSNTQGSIAEIIRYKNANSIDVKFDDNTIVKNKTYWQFRKGLIYNPNFYKEVRVGETGLSNKNEKITIIDYRNAKDIDIEIEDGTIINHATYCSFQKGTIKNPNFALKYGVGCIGQGKYKSFLNEKMTIPYLRWIAMLSRCYSEIALKNHPTYRECSVCPEWHNFQNFAKWFEENIWSDDCTVLDKDILIKGNKVYSPDNCVLVDNKINCLFVTQKNHRGKYLIGVAKEKGNTFKARGCKTKKFIGWYKTQEDAFFAYKKEKESYIKEIADEYKRKYKNFPDKLYKAMYSYEVDITD